MASKTLEKILMSKKWIVILEDNKVYRAING